MLLREVVAIRQFDRTIARPQPAEACPDKPHRALPVEARANASLEVGIRRNPVTTGARERCIHGRG